MLGFPQNPRQVDTIGSQTNVLLYGLLGDVLTKIMFDYRPIKFALLRVQADHSYLTVKMLIPSEKIMFLLICVKSQIVDVP